MRTIITIVKADYCLMSQLLLNILSNVTLPPYPSFFVHFKHPFVTHPNKISRFSVTVTPPPQNSERALGLVLLLSWTEAFQLLGVQQLLSVCFAGILCEFVNILDFSEATNEVVISKQALDNLH